MPTLPGTPLTNDEEIAAGGLFDEGRCRLALDDPRDAAGRLGAGSGACDICDGDTASPLAGEYTAGREPVDPDDGFRIVSIASGAAPGSYDITFTSELGAGYALDQSPDLSAASYSEIAPVVGSGETTTVNTDPGETARAFYRIRKVPPVVDP